MVVVDPPADYSIPSLDDCARRCKALVIPPSFKNKRSYGVFLSEFLVARAAGAPPTGVPVCTSPECVGLSQVFEVCKGTTVKNYMWAGRYMRVVSMFLARSRLT